MADQVQGVPAPPAPPSLAPAQAGQQAQQQQHDHPTTPVHAPPAQQEQQIVHLNWSHFKPEFSWKPDEDTEAHLLCTNDWVTAHLLLKVSKSKDFV